MAFCRFRKLGWVGRCAILSLKMHRENDGVLSNEVTIHLRVQYTSADVCFCTFKDLHGIQQ
jgi:hypothetical protein